MELRSGLTRQPAEAFQRALTEKSVADSASCHVGAATLATSCFRAASGKLRLGLRCGMGIDRVNHYPLFLDLRAQPVTVIGAGKVALRKIRSLLAAGAVVTVISPTARPAIQRLKTVRWLPRTYRQGDLARARLVIAATNDLAVNERVCREAHRRGLLVNCIAPPAAGNFIVPAVASRGRIRLAISTGGASPAFAKELRQELEQFLARGYGARLRAAAAQRRRKS